MKQKFFVLMLGAMFSCFVGVSQTQRVWNENFDSSISFTVSPTSSWETNTAYYASALLSMRGKVPNMTGQSAYLTTPVYDFATHVYSFVRLRFKHICKLSPRDTAWIEYKITGGNWTRVSSNSYLGSGNVNNYGLFSGFSAASYPQWQADDSLATPNASWWKEEEFDLSLEAGYEQTQFRFVVQHGHTHGTQIAYGWLLDDVEITACTHSLRSPKAEFVTPLVNDTIRQATMQAWTISAMVESKSPAPLRTPKLTYTAVNKGVTVGNDTLHMTSTGSNTWQATIPLFQLGTSVQYSLIAQDTLDNTTIIHSSYHLAKPDSLNYGDYSAAMYAIDMDTADVAPSLPFPIKVSILNTGDSNLTSATIYYSINGGTAQSYNWTGNLRWGNHQSDSIGNYIPKVNDYDTITVWVKLSNGETDTVLYDDTLRVLVQACAGVMNGDYTVDTSGGAHFATVQDALATLKVCGINGKVTFYLEDGTYPEDIDFSTIGCQSAPISPFHPFTFSPCFIEKECSFFSMFIFCICFFAIFAKLVIKIIHNNKLKKINMFKKIQNHRLSTTLLKNHWGRFLGELPMNIDKLGIRRTLRKLRYGFMIALVVFSTACDPNNGVGGGDDGKKKDEEIKRLQTELEVRRQEMHRLHDSVTYNNYFINKFNSALKSQASQIEGHIGEYFAIDTARAGPIMYKLILAGGGLPSDHPAVIAVKSFADVCEQYIATYDKLQLLEIEKDRKNNPLKVSGKNVVLNQPAVAAAGNGAAPEFPKSFVNKDALTLSAYNKVQNKNRGVRHDYRGAKCA